MGLFSLETWIKLPNDRDIISRWTAGKGEPRSHSLALPSTDSEEFSFLVVGDTGDSEGAGATLTPQEAVAMEMFSEYQAGRSPDLLLHLGDVVYMTGEKRLYDRNFRRPYAGFLTPESTADNLIFTTPFLPVPGNHDYYDLRGWLLWLARLPFFGPGLKAVVQQLFAFGMPEGGSDMGRVYMEAFVDLKADTSTVPLAYTPGTATRLPNRYYRFRHGTVDFFALDSNTLDAPPPWKSSPAAVREEAGARVAKLEESYRLLNEDLKQRQEQLDAWRRNERERISRDHSRQDEVRRFAREIAQALRDLSGALRVDGKAASPCEAPAGQTEMLAARWEDGEADLQNSVESGAALGVIEDLEQASDDSCAALRGVEECLGAVGEGEYKSAILAARDRLDRALEQWGDLVSSLPADLCDEIRYYSERALDLQRELALEQRRMRFRPEDHDSAQIDWLRAGLEQSVRDNPDGWRVVYLHHPLYTTIGNHCEQTDVQDVRRNLVDILRGRAHLVLSGHAHAFEWFRSDALPGTGIFVSGGGGQVTLRSSILDPSSLARNRRRYDMLREAGAAEWCGAGRGPDAQDGAGGNLYHFLKVEVSSDKLVVRPVGVRRLGREAYRREDPMPVFHVPEMTDEGIVRDSRKLAGVEVTRDGVVRPRWEE